MPRKSHQLAQMRKTTAILSLLSCLVGSTAFAGPREAVLSVYQRISGVPLVDQSKLNQLVSDWSSGNKKAVAQAALATDSFSNITAVNFAVPMSFQDHSPHAGYNDMVATLVGILRDNKDAREMLTGTYRYEGDRTLYTIPGKATPTAFALNNNTHYDELRDNNINLSKVLVPVNQTFPEVAGVLTTRGWIAAHGTAGTNRRLVSETIGTFACRTMEEVANTTRPTSFIRRDVDRAPGGDTTLFQNTCSGCHSAMDAMGAYSKVDFINNTPVSSLAGTPPANTFDANGVALKMNRNGTVFAPGFVTVNNAWTNLFKDSPALGFSENSPESGVGIASMASIFAESKAFSECMVKRVFKTICSREVSTSEASLVSLLADGFRQEGYKMKDLFESVALRPECSAIN